MKKVLFAVLAMAVCAFGQVELGDGSDSCQVLLISAATYNASENEVGDVVGIFPISHVFSTAEKRGFTIRKIAVSVDSLITLLEAKVNPTPENPETISYEFNMSSPLAVKIADRFVRK